MDNIRLRKLQILKRLNQEYHVANGNIIKGEQVVGRISIVQPVAPKTQLVRKEPTVHEVPASGDLKDAIRPKSKNFSSTPKPAATGPGPKKIYEAKSDYTGPKPSVKQIPKTSLSQCSNCGRNFSPDRLEVHFKICSNTKKREKFNSSAMRAKNIT